jgi:hypothetical protein
MKILEELEAIAERLGKVIPNTPQPDVSPVVWFNLGQAIGCIIKAMEGLRNGEETSDG